MIRNLLRITVIGYIWSRYGALIVSTLALFAWFWVVGKMHEDYIAFAQLHDEKAFLGISYLLKWAAFLLGIAVYWVFNSRVRNRLSKRTGGPVPDAGSRAPKDSGADDPFEGIRRKEKLRSRADLVIEKSGRER